MEDVVPEEGATLDIVRTAASPDLLASIFNKRCLSQQTSVGLSDPPVTVWVNYKTNAHTVVLHSWIIGCLEMVGGTDTITALNRNRWCKGKQY